MEVLTAFLGTGLVSFESIVFLIMGLVGMIGHYGKKRLKGQTKVSMKEYFGSNNPLSSIGTFATYAASMTGMIMGFDLATMSIYLVAIIGATCGWTIDSGVNTVKEK